MKDALLKLCVRIYLLPIKYENKCSKAKWNVPVVCLPHSSIKQPLNSDNWISSPNQGKAHHWIKLLQHLLCRDLLPRCSWYRRRRLSSWYRRRRLSSWDRRRSRSSWDRRRGRSRRRSRCIWPQPSCWRCLSSPRSDLTSNPLQNSHNIKHFLQVPFHVHIKQNLSCLMPGQSTGIAFGGGGGGARR